MGLAHVRVAYGALGDVDLVHNHTLAGPPEDCDPFEQRIPMQELAVGTGAAFHTHLTGTAIGPELALRRTGAVGTLGPLRNRSGP